MRREALVIGGGLAGCAAAIVLERAGCDVVLVEREAQAHHKVCGEFLSGEALGYLYALGLDVAALGAVPIETVSFGGSESRLPFAAMSLTRRRLDEALLELAMRAGVEVQRGLTVRALRDEGEFWKAQLDDEGERRAANVFTATGKHDLHGWARPASMQRDLVGFKMYFELAPAQAAELAGRVELILYRGGYAGLQPVEDGAANLCCLINRSWLRKLRGSWDLVLEHMQRDCPPLQRRLAGAAALLPKPLAISSIPYGFVRERTQPRLWHVGDQAAVIPSFTGDGMSIALHSGMLAAQMYLSGETAEAYQRQLHRELTRQVGFATGISRGLVGRSTRGVLTMAARLWPGALGLVAERTRVRAAARSLRG
jgi:flavin-dependent dehydrogenase